MSFCAKTRWGNLEQGNVSIVQGPRKKDQVIHIIMETEPYLFMAHNVFHIVSCGTLSHEERMLDFNCYLPADCRLWQGTKSIIRLYDTSKDSVLQWHNSKIYAT